MDTNPTSPNLDQAAYLDFLQSKFRFGRDEGFAIERTDIHSWLKPHQADLVQWACRKGRAAVFAAFGLGKSVISLEIMRLTLTHAGGRGLIVLPLGVRGEFKHDADQIGTPVRFVRRSDEVGGDGIYLTNYESVRDGKLDVSLFVAVALDEASVLRSYGSKTFQEFLFLFETTPYRYVATATPSPNSYKELIHYAAFLGITDSGLALTKYFQRDSKKANNLTIYKHMEAEFWLWLHSWAAFVQTPADLGHDNAGYEFPPLDLRVHEVPADDLIDKQDRDGQGAMFRDAALGLKAAAAEKRGSIPARVAKVIEIIRERDDPTDQVVVWCDLNDEQDAIEAALRGIGVSFTSLRGNQDIDVREDMIAAWKRRETVVFLSKPIMYGAGVNLQQCHRMIFAGVGYKFQDAFQGIHRIVRFGQHHPCQVDFIYCETEREIWREFKRKWSEHQALTARMSAIIARHGLSTLGIEAELARTIGVKRQEGGGTLASAVLNDTVLETAEMATNSLDMILTSMPFGVQYEYSASINDMGHNDDNTRFFAQMDFLTPNLLRTLKPGRIMAVHVKDRIRFGNVTGYGMPSVEPFHADCIAHYRRHGFIYCGMIHVNTDVVRENDQTYRLGWTENGKDSTKMGVGCPEYVLLFRKLPSDTSRAYADDPVTKQKPDCVGADGEVGPWDDAKRPVPGTGYSRGRWQIDAHSFWRSSGDRLLSADEFAGYDAAALARAFDKVSASRIYDHEQHVALAERLDAEGQLPATFMVIAPGATDPDTWSDVIRMRTLNNDQSGRNLALHVCPLATDLVKRLIERYTNKNELIYDPFGGLGTVPYMAVKQGRRGLSCELNAEYWRDSLRYLRDAEREANAPTLFDMEGLRA